MIKIALCDCIQEELDCAHLNCLNYIRKHPEYNIELKVYNDVTELSSTLETGKRFDIMILAIFMKELTGIEFARKIRTYDQDCELIFITSSTEHAIEAFSLNARHYLLKPCQSAKFEEAIDRSIASLEKRKNDYIILNTCEGCIKVVFSNLMYVESKRNYQYIYTKDDLILKVRMTSKEMFQKLSHDKRFYKYGSSYILNLHTIREVTKDDIVFDNQQSINMQRRQYKSLVETYTRI